MIVTGFTILLAFAVRENFYDRKPTALQKARQFFLFKSGICKNP
jgi:hypothetical protein